MQFSNNFPFHSFIFLILITIDFSILYIFANFVTYSVNFSNISIINTL